MRLPIRQRQTIHGAHVRERLDGPDTIIEYDKPKRIRATVSYTAGTPEEIAAGYVPDYDRYITLTRGNADLKESDVLWVDVSPEISGDGKLAVAEDGSVTTPPDYVVRKELQTQTGLIVRYGISKIKGR